MEPLDDVPCPPVVEKHATHPYVDAAASAPALAAPPLAALALALNATSSSAAPAAGTQLVAQGAPPCGAPPSSTPSLDKGGSSTGEGSSASSMHRLSPPIRRLRTRAPQATLKLPPLALHPREQAVPAFGPEHLATLPPMLASSPPIRPPPAAPPLCECAQPSVWYRGRWLCGQEEAAGCEYETRVPPPHLSTPLCECHEPCKWLLGRWWCQRYRRGGCAFESQPELGERPSARVSPADTEVEHARSTAALLTAHAYGLGTWCFVAPSNCGLGLFARTPLCAGQAIIEYDGPRLPLALITRGEYVLEVPGQGTAIDAAHDNCVRVDGFGAYDNPAIRANHSRQPNAEIEHWPAVGDDPDRLVLVSRESIAAGAEVRFDYENGARAGTYWRRIGQRPREMHWRLLRQPPPPPTGEEPVVDHLAWRRAQKALPATGKAAADATGKASLELPKAVHEGGNRSSASAGGWSDELLESLPEMLRSLRHEQRPPLEWEGPAGGDVALRRVIALVQRTDWLQDCISKGEGKVRLWELVATHLRGRTARECQDRWRWLQSHEL